MTWTRRRQSELTAPVGGDGGSANQCAAAPSDKDTWPGRDPAAPVLSGEKFPPAPLSARQARPRGGCQAGKPRPRRQYRRGSSRRSRRPLLPSGARADSRHELRGHRLWRSLAGFWIDPAPALQLLFYPANSATAAQTAQSNEAPITEIARAMASGGSGVLPSSTKPCSVSPHLLGRPYH